MPADLNLQERKVRIKAQKGHPQQWIDISHAMMVELANLPAKRPLNRRTGERLEPRVFGYTQKNRHRRALGRRSERPHKQGLTGESYSVGVEARRGSDNRAGARGVCVAQPCRGWPFTFFGRKCVGFVLAPPAFGNGC